MKSEFENGFNETRNQIIIAHIISNIRVKRFELEIQSIIDKQVIVINDSMN